MKNAKNEVEKAKVESDESFGDDANTVQSKQQYIMNQSYQFCERLKFGRLSFKGMNTYVETIMYNKKLE